jgi:L,D-transpeptidase YcbB
MESRVQLIPTLKISRLFSLACLILAIWVYFPQTAMAAIGALKSPIIASAPDTSISEEIKRQLTEKAGLNLNYPNSTERFYAQNYYHTAWIKPQSGFGKTWQAMLTLDCVLQFGLAHTDYHPKELIYDKLHDILEKPEKYNAQEKVHFELTLTDALITFINHLHYGKLNPDFPANKLDEDNTLTFHAENTLLWALEQPDFYGAVVSAQPESPAYKNLQHQMYLLVGLYSGDCYEVPDSTIRKMAINMERLRWIDSEDKTYIQINIPSFTLTFQKPDTAYQFKVIVGKPSSPTPVLQSYISHFTTAPEWKVPRNIFINEILPKAIMDTTYLVNHNYSIYDKTGKYVVPNTDALAHMKRYPGKYSARQSSGCDNALGLIVFRFQNIYDIFLHDTPEQQLFYKEERAFSHSCIRVEHAEKLAGLLLKNDGSAGKLPAMRNALEVYQTKNFMLKKPVRIRITYLTCEVKDGTLIYYKDIYNLDKSMEMALYNSELPLTMR